MIWPSTGTSPKTLTCSKSLIKIPPVSDIYGEDSAFKPLKSVSMHRCTIHAKSRRIGHVITWIQDLFQRLARFRCRLQGYSTSSRRKSKWAKISHFENKKFHFLFHVLWKVPITSRLKTLSQGSHSRTHETNQRNLVL